VSLQKFTDSKRNEIKNATKNQRKDLYKALVNEFVAGNDVQGPQQTAQVHSKLKRRTQNPPVNFIVYISFHINPLIFIIIISTRLLNFMDQMRWKKPKLKKRKWKSPLIQQNFIIWISKH